MNELVPRTGALSEAFPAILQRAGKAACFAADEFFSAKISNPHTRRAYARPVGRCLTRRVVTGTRRSRRCCNDRDGDQRQSEFPNGGD